jgi:hypothetical protein
MVRRVLAAGGRALLIAGSAHFDRTPPGVRSSRWGPIPDLIERVYPHSVWIVQPYAPFFRPHPEVENTIRSWPLRSVAAVAGTPLAEVPAADVYGPGAAGTLGHRLDALLYLG